MEYSHVLIILACLLILDLLFLAVMLWRYPHWTKFIKLQRLQKQLLQGNPLIAASIVDLCITMNDFHPSRNPKLYVGMQNNLGLAYSELQTGNRATNLARAIDCYQEALRFQTAKAEPYYYGEIQINLGLAYYRMPTGDRIANLTKAIACYQEALRFWTAKTKPQKCAAVHHNLGLAYYSLPTGDRIANLTQAIKHYQEALRFRTVQRAPLDYALTQNNLGLVYAKLPTGDRATNLNQAITCYQEALRIWTAKDAPFNYARVVSNIGFAYHSMPTGNRTTNLNLAIACYKDSLRFWTVNNAPFAYAEVYNKLGIAYYDMPTGDQATNLNRAISCYQESLLFWKPKTTPLDYALVQNNLGLVYAKLPTGDQATNLSRAITCYQEALRFWTTETDPYFCRLVNRNLANLYFLKEDWQMAFEIYQIAIKAGERLYQAGLSPESKTAEIVDDADTYRHAAFAAARWGKPTEALLILEQGKTRLLSETLRLGTPRPAEVPDEIWAAFEHAGSLVRILEPSRGAAVLSEMNDLVESYKTREQLLRSANATLDAAIERVRIYAPDFLQSIDITTIRSLIPDEQTVFIAFCITDKGCISLIVYRSPDQDVQAVEVLNFTRTRLRHIFQHKDSNGKVIGGWLKSYNRFLDKGDFDEWKQTMDNTLKWLGQNLCQNISQALPQSIKKIVFLPSSELFLFPLHAALLSPTQRLCDYYQISYAPSLDVLAHVQKRMIPGMIPDLYAVINPEEDSDLVFTPIEGMAIARLFANSQVVKGQEGTKQSVLTGIRGHTYVHFSCHGHYHWDDPTKSALIVADGHLTLADLQREIALTAKTCLVTLSACETGIIDTAKGSAEEYVGIPAGFMIAGVPCVLNSLWSVPDLSTSLLMERFYQNHLEGGMDFAAALREAQLWLRKINVQEVEQYVEQCYQRSGQTDIILYDYLRRYRSLAKENPNLCPYAHPYYWAAFIISGTPRHISIDSWGQSK
ncbi:hypothetical protein KSF_008050 [Reticulibacter mediterranei]|uniref:CHAT domain-containing protein n=1 Tax=Reticulibacter mediterranei TaxID=2778369 RepID=A0A8J3MYC3_9CHLR|nr:CHAT domain-containing tetratricopeptide repeat protein [Reticulibacter mediterranei]GHO90757.1 hypothetical protein KSF_008050 [Reticulibacter mediterranei]